MIPLFQSATLKLTGWYLAILMSISIIFSVAIYQLNFHEVNVRLENFQNEFVQLPDSPNVIIGGNELREAQSSKAAFQMAMTLLYTNIIILLAGGVGSYFLARRTLRPLEQAHEAQSRFVSDASHELRTPLTVMKAEIEVLLRDKKLDPHEAKELLESNLEEVNGLMRLSETLLSLSRLDDENLTRERLNMMSLIEESLRTYKQSRSRITLTGRKNLYVYGNKEALIELVSLLVDNALKYSPEKSPIHISLQQKNGTVQCSVSNSGDSLDSVTLQRLFERFYRADASRSKKGKKGYGLGLAIAKRIIEAHHGSIDASHKKGQTTFTFRLAPFRKNTVRPSHNKNTTTSS